MIKYEKEKLLLFTLHCNIPVNNRDTVVRVRGMPRCAEIDYRTHTHKTRDLKPAGFPIPVTIPTCTYILIPEITILGYSNPKTGI